jgi:hypothetical protein
MRTQRWFLFFTLLKDKIMSLDNMVLVEENKDDSPPTDDKELLA